MKWRAAAAVILCALLAEPVAFAHRIDEYLQATLLSIEAKRMHVSMRMVPGVLVAPSIIAGIDTDRDGVFSAEEQRHYAQRVLSDLFITVDGANVQPKLVAWSVPPPAQLRNGLGEVHLDYVVELPPGGPRRTFTLMNHHLNAGSVYLVNAIMPDDPAIVLLGQTRNERQSAYRLDFQQGTPGSQTRWSSLMVWANGLQLSGLFRLGMRHIAEGPDHLLFLLTLLLPAPLLTSGSRWGAAGSVKRSLLHILGIVTAFTLGHSVTLTLAALGFMRVPGRPVEVLIAVSILVSAIHAIRPVFPGREAAIAGFFGLIHGLAFAATLDRLGLAKWDRVVGVLAFNLGIEAMQMVVILAVLPSLLLLSRTRGYPLVRITGATLAGVAASGWIIERLFDRKTQVNLAMHLIERHSLGLMILLFVISLTSTRFFRVSAHIEQA